MLTAIREVQIPLVAAMLLGGCVTKLVADDARPARSTRASARLPCSR